MLHAALGCRVYYKLSPPTTAVTAAGAGLAQHGDAGGAAATTLRTLDVSHPAPVSHTLGFRLVPCLRLRRRRRPRVVDKTPALSGIVLLASPVHIATSRAPLAGLRLKFGFCGRGRGRREGDVARALLSWAAAGAEGAKALIPLSGSMVFTDRCHEGL